MKNKIRFRELWIGVNLASLLATVSVSAYWLTNSGRLDEKNLVIVLIVAAINLRTISIMTKTKTDSEET